jgi:hypothetical protein
MRFRRSLSDRQLFLISQATSSLSNFVPITLSILIRDIQLIGEIAIFQSLLTIFVSVTRSGIGIALLRDSGNGKHSQDSRFGLLVLIAMVFPTTFFYARYSSNLSPLFYFFFCLIVLSSISQEYLRARLISSNLFYTLVKADLVWLFASLLLAIIYLGRFSFGNILVIFLVGPLCSIVYVKYSSQRSTRVVSIGETNNKSRYEIMNLLALPLITFINVFFVNIIWSYRFGSEDIGMVRGLLFFFVPIQFVIGAFPLVILKDKASVSSLVTKKMRYVYLLICFVLSLAWGYFSQILTFEIVVIVSLLTLSVHSVIVSQEIVLLQIARKKSGEILLLRLLWAILLILSASFIPELISTTLQLALIMASADIVYAITLRLRYRNYLESRSTN